MSKRIAIAGAGISGLAAAVRLVQRHGADLQITIFEARNQTGGLLRTDSSADRLIEQSADMFTTKLPWAWQLCQQVGYTEELIPTNTRNRGARLVTGSGVHPIPKGFSLMVPKDLGGILRSPVLSRRGKLRLLLEPFFARWHRNFGKDWERLEDESLRSFAVRHWGKELFERIIQPLVAGIYTADPEKLSMKAALPEFVEMERQYGKLLGAPEYRSENKNEADGDFQDSLSAGGDRVAIQTQAAQEATGARYGLFLTPRQGMQHWIEHITEWLIQRGVHFELGHSVKEVHRMNNGWQLSLEDSTEPKGFDGVILALPAQRVAQLLEGSLPKLAEVMKKIESASAAIVVSVVDRDELPNKGEGLGFGLVVPEYLGRPIIAASFGSNKFPGRCPDQELLIRTFFGGALHPEYLERTDDELIQMAQRELRELLKAPQLSLQSSRVVRWVQAMPQYHVGHLSRVEWIEDHVQRETGFAVAGNAYRGVGIPQCIESGSRAAEKVLRDLGNISDRD